MIPGGHMCASETNYTFPIVPLKVSLSLSILSLLSYFLLLLFLSLPSLLCFHYTLYLFGSPPCFIQPYLPPSFFWSVLSSSYSFSISVSLFVPIFVSVSVSLCLFLCLSLPPPLAGSHSVIKLA